MEKNKKIWIFAPTMIVTPIVVCSLIQAVFVILWFIADLKTPELSVVIMYFFIYVIVPFFITAFMVLWHLQFIIFKDDYFIFGNVLKKELRSVK